MISVQRYMSEDEILEKYPDTKVLIMIDSNTEYFKDGGFAKVWVERVYDSVAEYIADSDNMPKNSDRNKPKDVRYIGYNSCRNSSPYPD